HRLRAQRTAEAVSFLIRDKRESERRVTVTIERVRWATHRQIGSGSQSEGQGAHRHYGGDVEPRAGRVLLPNDGVDAVAPRSTHAGGDQGEATRMAQVNGASD